MKVRALEGKCCGHARCAAIAPQLFLLDDDGYLAIAETIVPPEQEALAQRGVRACPERAIEFVAD